MRVYGIQKKDEPTPAPYPRYEPLLDKVQVLNDMDTRCLLDYLLGVRRTDYALLAQAEGWIKQNVTPVRKMTLADLQELSKIVEQSKAVGAKPTAE